MPYYCTVPRCTSMAGKAKNVSFHQFPRDEELAELWNKILKRGKPYTKYSKVCSLHFTPDDYTITSVGKNKGQWRTLRKDAIPSQNLPSESPTPYQRKQWGGWPSNNPPNILDPTIQQHVAQAIYMQTMLAIQAAGTTEVPTLNQNGIPPLQAPAEDPSAHTSTANDTDILKGKQTNTNERNSYKCTECSKCFKDPDVYTLHRRGHIKNEKNEKENFNLNVTLQANPILANLLKTNTENGENSLIGVERLLIAALAVNVDAYMRNVATMIKKEDRGDLSHDRGDISHGRGDVSHDRSDLSHDRCDVSLDRGDISHNRSDLSLDRGDISHDRGDLSLYRSDLTLDRGDMTHENSGLSHGRGDMSHDRGDKSHDTGDIRDDRCSLGYNMGNLCQDRSSLSNGEYVQNRLNLRDLLNKNQENKSRNGVLSQEHTSERSDPNHDRNTERNDANNDINGLYYDTGSLVHDTGKINNDTGTSNTEHRSDTNIIRDRIIELYRNNDAYDDSRNIRYYENDQLDHTEYSNGDRVTNDGDYSGDRGIKNSESKEGIHDRGMNDEKGTNDDVVMYVDKGVCDERGLSDAEGIIKDEEGIMSDEEGIIKDEAGIISDEEGINDSQGIDGPNCDSDFCESIDSNKLIIDETF